MFHQNPEKLLISHLTIYVAVSVLVAYGGVLRELLKIFRTKQGLLNIADRECSIETHCITVQAHETMNVCKITNKTVWAISLYHIRTSKVWSNSSAKHVNTPFDNYEGLLFCLSDLFSNPFEAKTFYKTFSVYFLCSYNLTLAVFPVLVSCLINIFSLDHVDMRNN